ncbi:MAG TPA: hypothetical protein VGN20_14185 [Mucilaginibacter sp.]|jgi:hypothetical protein
MKILSECKASLFITALILFTTTAFAQQPAFSGTWTLKEKTNLSGTDYGNAVPAQIKLDQSATELIITRTEVGPDEDSHGMSSTEKLPLETGKGTVGTTADQRKIISKAIINGKVLTEIKTISQPNSENTAIRTKETSTLSDDGKTLTLVKEFTNLTEANDKWTSKGTYEKQ